MTTVLQAPLPGASPFSRSSIHSSSYPDLSTLNNSIPFGQHSSQTSRYSRHEYDRLYPDSGPSTAPSSPQLTYSSRRDSYASTPASSLCLDQGLRAYEEDEDMAFPAFEPSEAVSKPIDVAPIILDNDDLVLQTPSPLADEPTASNSSIQDDQVIEQEPTKHVDYLSHEWKEEDIWRSWSYISHRRGSIPNSMRLENASWRSWTKAKNRLRTISPETLNWLKDCDVTWLYGPLQEDTSAPPSQQVSPPPSRLSHASSFIAKKPILKKKSASAAILERSRSQHSLLQRAGDIIRIQQHHKASKRPTLRRGNSEFILPRYDSSSVANTPIENEVPAFTEPRLSFGMDLPTPSDCKHVLFNEEVRQVQAIDSEDDDDKIEEEDDAVFDTDEDDDCGLMMAPSQRSGRLSGRSTPRGSFSNESKTIVPLPSTTLKYRHDTPEPPEIPIGFWPKGRKLSPSPSQETLRPTNPSQNFLIDDDPEVEDGPWQAQPSTRGGRSPYDEEDDTSDHPNMRRTDSGMFMPYEDEDEAAMNNTLFGQAVYAVNTFRDIAHVVWNVGWNRK